MTPAYEHPGLAALHDAAVVVACELPPRGCGAPIGQRCVNLTAHRRPGEHPPATKVPHTRRSRTAAHGAPAARQLEAPPPPRRPELSTELALRPPAFDDDLPPEPPDDDEPPEDWPW